ncbi:hypothetical protein HOD38_02265 [archaeon]|jgi:uncharacterized integral membrane protein|nr:hypothetical protein [archaeon]MBT4397066.1 hypothetical protein [archaeon]MBT4441207.1 hypothetical protein [archaeon]
MKKGEGFFDPRVWSKILDFNVNIDTQLTTKANFIFAASTIILMYIINRVYSMEFSTLLFREQMPWILLIVGAFISSLLALMVVLPKLRIFSKKERIKTDIFYYKNIKKHYNRKQYARYLDNLSSDPKKISAAYSNQIYSLATNIIPYKFRMLKISGWVLIISLFASILFFAIF